jgi:hypothetical protein
LATFSHVALVKKRRAGLDTERDDDSSRYITSD